MNEASKFEDVKNKLTELCDRHNLVFHFYPNCYPIQMVFRPMTDVYAQTSMLEQDDGYISPNAKLIYLMRDGEIEEKTEGRTRWPKSLKDKLLKGFRDMHLCYLEFFHRNLMERNVLSYYQIPQISVDEDVVPPQYIEEEVQDTASGAKMPQISTLADEATKLLSKLLRMENKASADLLELRMNIGAGTALRVMRELVSRGVVSVDESLNFELLPYDVPDDEG